MCSAWHKIDAQETLAGIIAIIPGYTLRFSPLSPGLKC